jgi:hypothetical protein
MLSVRAPPPDTFRLSLKDRYDPKNETASRC